MTEHKHASVLRAIADGVPQCEFEVKHISNEEFSNMDDYGGFREWISNPNKWEVHRKLQYIMVNGFKVPKPLDFDLEQGTKYFVADPTTTELHMSTLWTVSEVDRMWLRRQLSHSTKESAIAHAKAMLGIDPEAA